jgi:large subunit ribosomal protein L21
MKYAIVETGGKQFRAVEGGTLEVDRLPVEAGKNLKLEQVLLLADGDSVTVGTPIVRDSPVWVKVLQHFKGPKVTIFNYSPKKRIRVKTGHRQNYTRLLVEQIGGSELVKKAPVKAEKAAEVKGEKPARARQSAASSPKGKPASKAKAAPKAEPKAATPSPKGKAAAAAPKAKAAPKPAPKAATSSQKGTKPAAKPTSAAKGKPAGAAKKPAPKAPSSSKGTSSKGTSSPKGKKPAGK